MSLLRVLLSSNGDQNFTALLQKLITTTLVSLARGEVNSLLPLDKLPKKYAEKVFCASIFAVIFTWIAEDSETDAESIFKYIKYVQKTAPIGLIGIKPSDLNWT